MLKHGRVLASALAVLLFPTAMSAQVFNGGLPSGYVCNGNCGTSTANGVVGLAPGGGTRFGFISTDNAPLQDPLGISGTQDGTTLLSSVFTAAVGQPLSFRFNYITTDGSAGFPDYAFVRLLGGPSPLVLFTARTTPTGNTVPGHDLPGLAPGVTLTPSSTPILAPGFSPGGAGPVFAPLGASSGTCFDVGCGYTGWILANYAVAVAGTYQLQFGVFNAEDRDYESALAFDFAAGLGGTPNVVPPVVGIVPEPASLTLLATGLAGVFGLLRRKRKTKEA